MKKFRFAIYAIFALFLGVLSSCDKEQPNEVKPGTEASASVDIVSIDMKSAVFSLDTQKMGEYAYLCYPADNKPAATPIAAIVFKEGQSGKLKDGKNSITIDGLEPLNDYVIYLAIRSVENEYWKEVFAFNLSTTEAKEDITMLGVNYDGYKMYLRTPESVKQNGSVLRYAFYDLFTYNLWKGEGQLSESILTDAEMLGYGHYIPADQSSMLVDINEDNIYLSEADTIMAHIPVVPGEPTMFFAGEFLDDGEGYLTPAFDYDMYFEQFYADNSITMDQESACWDGYFKRMFFESKKPSVLDADLNVKISNVGSIDATISVNPDPEVFMYAFYVTDDDTYRNNILPALNNNPDYMQWFVTSWNSAMYGVLQYDIPMDFQLYGFLNSTTPETKYHVFVVGVGDETMSEQVFEHKEFFTTNKQLGTPEIVVTALDKAPEGEEDSPYEIWFNVKCTNTKPEEKVISAQFACNYTDAWVKELNSGYTNSSLIASSYAYFSEAELEEINSPDGLNVSFATREGMSSRLGVLAYNKEMTPNDVDSEDTKAVAEIYAGYADPGKKVNSPLFDELVGTWTLTADAKYWVYDTYDYVYDDDGNIVYTEDWGPKLDEDGNLVLDENGEVVYELYRSPKYDMNKLIPGHWTEETYELKSKVEITNGVVYPETIGQEVYAAYPDSTKTAVDRLYESFKQDAAAWNERLRANNRMLCVGFNDYLEMSRNLNAFEAFYASDYSCYDNITLLNDFGPKWYLEIDDKGNVTAPFNSTRFAPMNNSYWYETYMAALNLEDTGFIVGYDEEGELTETLSFPVEVSEDRDTIIVKPLVKDGKEHYPSAMYYFDLLGEYAIMIPRYVSELVLTRGYTEQAKESVPSVRAETPVKTDIQGSRHEISNRKSRTSFEGAVKYGKADYRILSFDEIRENVLNNLNKNRK